MQTSANPRIGFDDLVREAGLGSLVWSTMSYRAARWYHLIIAIFTVAILTVSLAFQLNRPELAALFVSLYLLYFGARKLMPEKMERQFYKRPTQFIRAQAGVIAIAAIMLFVPQSEQTSLWLLSVLVILLTSKHCNTWQVVLMTGEACAVLLAARLVHGTLASGLFDLAGQWLWLGLLTFVLHFLVRNIEARDKTIAAHRAVNALADEADMTQAHQAIQWQPMLIALLQHLRSDAASVWTFDPRTRRLHRVAAICRDHHTSEWLDLSGETADATLALDAQVLIAEVARSGESNYTMEPTYAASRSLSLAITTELAVPIDMGTRQHRSIVGVLSVGFSGSAFKPRLLEDYYHFIQALLSQAKPMLVYAQRLEELTALQVASQQISQSLALDEVLDSILKALVEHLGFEFATISLVDFERRIIECVKGLNISPRQIKMSKHSLDAQDIQADIVRTGKTEIIDGWDERFDRRIWTRFGHGEMVRVFMPIEVGPERQIIGTIEAGYRQVNRSAISPDQLRLLIAFKGQVGMAVEHARLLQRVDHKANVLTSLHHVGQIIGTARQPADVLRGIASNAATLLNADIVMVYRYHHATRSLDHPAIVGAILGKAKLNLNLDRDNILTRLLRETQPYYSADARRDPQLIMHSSDDGGDPQHATFVRRQNIKSVAGIPLNAQGEIVGVMFVNYRKRHQFDPDERQVHELFAQQAALAIKNAEVNELSHDLIVREERNHLSRELHHSVSQALFGIVLKADRQMNKAALDDAEVRAELAQIRDIANLASTETGFIIDELRAPVDEDRYLQRGLEEYTHRIMRWYSLPINLVHSIDRELEPAAQQILMRFAREAINNAVKHSHCSTITVRSESQGNCITLQVCDDGQGFDPERVPTNKLGLKSMQELAAQVGGFFKIDTTLGAGTRISLQIFIDDEARIT